MSKTQITGVVEKAYKSDKGYWSVLVDGTWYSTYKTDNTKFENKEVTFEAEKKGNFWNAGALAPTGNDSAPAAAPSGGGGGGGDHRQQSIVLQSSYKTAGDIVGNMLAADKLGLGSKKADQLANCLGFVDEVAYHIYTNCMAPGDFLAAFAGVPTEDAAASDGAKKEYNPVEA